jgi:NAD-dependent deacetylase
MQKIIQQVAERVAAAQSVAVLTGAGISAESGVATFRDPDGLWTKFKPHELASMDGFMSNPELVWQWYEARRDVVHNVEPNAGHVALSALQELLTDGGRKFTLATQNVDRLHHRAGSKDVLELHGNIIENYCSRCHKPHEVAASVSAPALQPTAAPAQASKEPPRCTFCGSMVRPAVVWFGEMLPADVLEAASEAASGCDVYFSIGTSAEVYPAAGLPLAAKQRGAFVVEINPNPTALTPSVDVSLRAASGAVLPELVAQVQARLQGR